MLSFNPSSFATFLVITILKKSGYLTFLEIFNSNDFLFSGLVICTIEFFLIVIKLKEWLVIILNVIALTALVINVLVMETKNVCASLKTLAVAAASSRSFKL